jgi:hypothetical protein
MKLPTNNSRNFQFFDSQSTVNSQQSTMTDGATGIDITADFSSATENRYMMNWAQSVS